MRHEPTDVSEAFLRYYKKLLGSNVNNRRTVMPEIVTSGDILSAEHLAILEAPYTAEEVKEALFSIPGSKAPSLDGFGSYFYRDAWPVVGEDVIAAVLETLQSGRILKEVNDTKITLIPKTRCPSSVVDLDQSPATTHYINVSLRFCVGD